MISTSGDEFHLDIKKVLSFSNPTLYLFEFLKNHGFDFDQCQQVISTLSVTHSSGKSFFSKENRLLIDRKIMILSPRKETDNTIENINKEAANVTYPINLTLKELSVEEFAIDFNPNCVFLDMDKLNFPLTLRNWQDGDKFQPLGMKGKKKVSDFLIDEKVSLDKKEKTLVLISDKKICWVVGYRISDLFKISESTKTVLKLTLE